MKITKLSLIATLAISSAIAGGDIIPAPLPPVEDATTVKGKLQAYYYTNDNTPNNLFSELNNQLGTAVTLDVAHKLFEGVTLNFSAVGFANLMDKGGYMEQSATGAYMNVANLTATYWDTTLIAGRQTLATPMLGSFDWKLAPGSFEAYTLMNNSIENLTLIGSYVTKWRENDDSRVDGNTFTDLTTNSKNNWAVGAVYKNESLFDASVWYYNVDAGSFTTSNAVTTADKYTQIYADAGISYSGVRLDGQYVLTQYSTAVNKDASAFGGKLSYTLYDIALSGAFVQIVGNATGFVGVDSLYTSSWNTFASTTYNPVDGDASTYKVDAKTKVYGIDMEASFAGYGKNGQEIDVILGYELTDSWNFGAIYSNTTPNTNPNTAVNAVEVIATYKF